MNWKENLLYRTGNGRILDDNELNRLSVLEIEDLDIHAIDDPHWWREAA